MSKRLKPDRKQLFNSLAKDFHDLVNNKQVLHIAVENFLHNIVDEMTLGIIFDLHRKYKTNAYDLDVDDSCDEVDSGDVDVFAQPNLKKIQDCMCPNCDKSVPPENFALHLQTCMGLGRERVSRYASRRVVYNNSDRDNSAFEGIPSDDDKDDDWNSGDRRKKKKEKTSSRKKNRGTPRKIIDMEPVIETLNVDVEGDDDDLTNLRAILYLQDHSNSTSPADSASSSGSTKKKDKSKSKKSSKRDKSPAPNMSNK